jgi:hypothetical protein
MYHPQETKHNDLFAPKGPKQISPGYRPGKRNPTIPSALKGRNKSIPDIPFVELGGVPCSNASQAILSSLASDTKSIHDHTRCRELKPQLHLLCPHTSRHTSRHTSTEM